MIDVMRGVVVMSWWRDANKMALDASSSSVVMYTIVLAVLAGAASIGLLVVAGRLSQDHFLHWTHITFRKIYTITLSFNVNISQLHHRFVT